MFIFFGWAPTTTFGFVRHVSQQFKFYISKPEGKPGPFKCHEIRMASSENTENEKSVLNTFMIKQITPAYSLPTKIMKKYQE